jgi:hypothetical protein
MRHLLGFTDELFCVAAAYMLQRPGWGRDTGDEKSFPVSYEVTAVRTVTIGDADNHPRRLYFSPQWEKLR